MSNLGGAELIIILVIVLLIFGVGRIARVGRELGTGIREFRKGLSSDEQPKDSTSADSKQE